VEQFSSRDLSLDSSVLGEMVEDAYRGYYGPIFMDLTLNWFTSIIVSFGGRVFAGKHRMGRREVAGLEERCGGMIQCGRVERIAEITFRA
jgi:hypothetical protein